MALRVVGEISRATTPNLSRYTSAAPGRRDLIKFRCFCRTYPHVEPRAARRCNLGHFYRIMRKIPGGAGRRSENILRLHILSRNDDEWVETRSTMFPSPQTIIRSGCAILTPPDSGRGRYVLHVFVFTTSDSFVWGNRPSMSFTTPRGAMRENAEVRGGGWISPINS